MEKFVYLRDVVTLALDPKKCIGCGMCLIVCPQAVLSLHEGRARIENRDHCMECGACSQNCPTEAVTVQAGVGCAAAVINSALGRDGSSCCCVIETDGGAGSGNGREALPLGGGLEMPLKKSIQTDVSTNIFKAIFPHFC